MFCSTTFHSTKNLEPRTYTVDGDEIADIFPSDEAFMPYTQNAAGDTDTNAVYQGKGDGGLLAFKAVPRDAHKVPGSGYRGGAKIH